MHQHHGLNLTTARLIVTALFLLILAACGGTGNPGSGGGTVPPNPPTIQIQADSTTVPANPLLRPPALSAPTTIQLTARVRGTGGAVVPDGTTVNITTNNVSVGTISIPDDPETDDVNEFTSFFASAGTDTSGGNATFFFTSGQTPGTARLTVSTTDPGTGNAVTAFIDIVVNAVDPAEQVTITAGQTSLPVNTANVGPFIGSPFLTEVTIEFVGTDGIGVNPAGDTFGVSIAPVSSASFSTLDDPETEDVNEFFVGLGSGPVNAVGGRGTVFVNANSQPGTATLTVSGADPFTGQNFSVSQDFTIVSGAADGIPVSASLQVPAQPVFVQGVGSNNSLLITAQLTDAGGQLVSAPEAINNVVIELVPPGPNNSRLQAVDASGATVSGNEIAVPSVNGLASFSFISGNTGGVHQLNVTADGADNNVDNGIQQPVTGISSVTVGNGQLAAIELVSPTENAITINRVTDVVDPDEDIDVDPDTGLIIPPDPDGTYSLPYTVIATDPFGAPVPTGTVISFGKIDAPTTNFIFGDEYVFSNGFGNPQEGGTLFTVPLTIPAPLMPPDDGFLDDPDVADEAVQFNDTLVTFGKQVAGNDELESSRFVDSVNSDQSLNVQSPFNDNNGAGTIVNDGNAIPYVIGRSTIGNIVAQAATAANGTATVTLTYPINAIGRPVVIWAQGTRPDGTVIQTVGDAVAAVFPGIAPASLIVGPNPVRGNSTEDIVLCALDALSAPIRNAPISFGPSDNFSVSVSPTPLITGADGCVAAEVTTSGITFDQNEPAVIFSSVGATATLNLVPPGPPILQAPGSCQLLTDDNFNVIITVLSGENEPLPGIDVTANCTGVTVDPTTDATNTVGQAVFTLTAGNTEDTGQCTFTADAQGVMLSTTVDIQIGGVIPSPGASNCN
ncbi:MAG: hypothetical protein KKC01_02150 [Gammaproteobacteria bacterium]|nr:hypothetical protein [Gammaproteobacteria bacterium]